MLKNDFVPAAIDQFFQRKQKDAEGEFYRKIAGQGPRNNFNSTTQGRYVCTPDGTLIGFNNNRGPERIKRIMKEALKKHDSDSLMATQPIETREVDAANHYPLPKDGLIMRVNAKILGGYEKTDDWTSVFQGVISRDNLWIKKEEKVELAKVIQAGGNIPPKLASRIARFHLIDNTRGEPPRWKVSEIQHLEMTVDASGKIQGKVHLETKDGKRGYVAELLGHAQAEGDSVTRFDLVSKGQFWGSGRFTHFAPEGKFPLAIAFRLADGSDLADSIIPHGSKGWLPGYYE